MATRTSGGNTGILVALVIFILLSVGLTVTSMLLYTSAQTATVARTDAEEATRSYVRPDERTRDDFKRLESAAAGAGKSVAGYQREQFQNVMQSVLGNRDAAAETLQSWTQSLADANLNPIAMDTGESLKGYLNRLQQALVNANSTESSLKEKLALAQQSLSDEVARRDQMQTAQEAAIAGMQAEIDRMKNLVDQYDTAVRDTQGKMQDRVADLESRYSDESADLKARLQAEQSRAARLTAENKALNERVSSMRGGAQDEATLVDGTVLRALEGNDVFLSLGSRDRIILGMTFEVYGSAADLRLDSNGNYPRGKATVEVTRVSDTTSTARVIRATPGQSVIEGDVLVNAVYDKDKRYTLFVFGRFDLDGENGPTESETATIKARIVDWGGTIKSEFAGDIDFLVLGQEPAEPAPLRPDPTQPEIREYQRQKKERADYLALMDRAAELSIPILNQNRMLTLIGYYVR